MMDINTFSESLKKELKEIQIEIDEKKIEKFYNYMNLLLEWNNKFNLTAITKQEEIITKHFVDSLTIYKHINSKSKIIDVGTGAGFPGIPIKIMNDDIEIVLLDSLNKRIRFLEEVIKTLELENVKTIHSRAEDMGIMGNYREKYDIVVARAVAPINILLEYTLPLSKIGGKCIYMKGPRAQEEVLNIKRALNILGGDIEKIEEIILPQTDMERNIVIINKINQTDKKYPRTISKIRKNPL